MYNYLQLRSARLMWLAAMIGLPLFVVISCKHTEEPINPDPVFPLGESITTMPADVATKWGDMTLRIAKGTPGNTPTYASRSFGYLGLTMYETGVYGIADHQSLVQQLSNLSSLPKPETGKTYDWALSINAGQAFMLKQLYNNTADVNKLAIDSLSSAIKASRMIESGSKPTAPKNSGWPWLRLFMSGRKLTAGMKGIKIISRQITTCQPPPAVGFHLLMAR